MRFCNFLCIFFVSAIATVGRITPDAPLMPITQAQSLSGHDLVLPAAVAGHPAVIVIGFSQGSSKAMERWDKEIGAKVTAKAGVPLYNVAVIQDAPRFVRSMIKGSMKAIIPAAGQDRFLTVVQGEEQLKSAVDFTTAEGAYIVVLDSAGKIVFHTHDDPSDAVKKQIIDQIKE